MDITLDFTSLKRSYETGISPEDVIAGVFDLVEAAGLRPVWISLVSRERAVARARQLTELDRSSLPLYGVPFAVKDNIDVEGMVTTAACPAFSYVAQRTATSVARLEAAGAILIGKTNLDQFATGLVGVRSPYGVCTSVFNDEYISGGSSSGSAVAVASGLVSFSLGTDTAGSGRVPAAFNNIIGLKPTRGLISTSGVVPACRSLDCVSIFALTAGDAMTVFEAAVGFDHEDPYSRSFSDAGSASPWLNSPFRVGVPRMAQREFFGDDAARELYTEAIARMNSLGASTVEIDYQPFSDAAALLYKGPWVAERLAAIQGFFDQRAPDVHPVVREIIEGARSFSAVDSFNGQYEMSRLRQLAEATWGSVDVLMLPTTGTTYKIVEVEADPLVLNTSLGYYTNFVNLLDLAAIAVPAGFRQNGIPFGVTFVGRAHTDRALVALADRFHRVDAESRCGTSVMLSATSPMNIPLTPPGCTLLAVVGAHLTGQPLNHQLTSRGAKLVLSTKTAKGYRLFALPNTTPQKPGLVKSSSASAEGIEVEVWAMPTYRFGSFVLEIPSPLGIGTVELADGRGVKGFICEPAALEGALEISEFGGWRAYLASKPR